MLRWAWRPYAKSVCCKVYLKKERKKKLTGASSRLEPCCLVVSCRTPCVRNIDPLEFIKVAAKLNMKIQELINLRADIPSKDEPARFDMVSTTLRQGRKARYGVCAVFVAELPKVQGRGNLTRQL